MKFEKILRTPFFTEHFKMDVLKNFGIFTGKLLSWSLFLINFYYFVILLKRDSKNRCFPVNIAKFLRTAFL